MSFPRLLLSGGPTEGVVETHAVSRDGRVWTIQLIHVNCACAWCAGVDDPSVVHVYERRDDDVFTYRESREADSSDVDPTEYGGAFDGFTVTSDADPGL